MEEDLTEEIFDVRQRDKVVKEKRKVVKEKLSVYLGRPIDFIVI